MTGFTPRLLTLEGEKEQLVHCFFAAVFVSGAFRGLAGSAELIDV
jgi:hypothetical protein